MFLPEAYSLSIVLMFVTMLCWGSWANMTKIDPKWRFELFYWDFGLGVLITGLILALTLGQLGQNAPSFLASFLKQPLNAIFLALGAGATLNIGNILLVGSITLTGLSIAFPVGVGIALVLGTLMSYFIAKVGNLYFILLGVFLILVAIVLASLTQRAKDKQKNSHKKVSFKGIAMAIAGGVLMSFFYPLLAKSMTYNYMTPYNALVFFCGGLFISSFVFNTYFMKQPVEGPSLKLQNYLQGSPKQHLFGVLGGFIWCLGLGMNLIASTVAGPAIAYAFGQGATLVASLWGVLVWREFKGVQNVLALLIIMFSCYLLGLILIGVAKLV